MAKVNTNENMASTKKIMLWTFIFIIIMAIVIYVVVTGDTENSPNTNETVELDGMQGKWGQVDKETGLTSQDFYLEFDGKGNVELYTSRGNPAPRLYTISDKIYITYTDGTEYMSCEKKTIGELICSNNYGTTGWVRFN